MSNQNDNFNENDQLQKMEKQAQNVAKQTVRDALRIAGKVVKKVAKKAISTIVKALGWKLALIILIVVAVIIFVAGLWYVIKYSTFLEIIGFVEDDTNDTGQVSMITEIDPDNRELTIDDELLKEKIEEWFNKSGVEKNYVGIDENLEIIEKLLKAEITTLYPDLRKRGSIGTTVEEDELQGCVQFLRHYSDGKEELLEYMPYDEYAKEVAKLGVKLDEEQTQKQIYSDKNGVETQYNKLKDKFTLDKDKNLIVIGLYTSETKVTYNDFAKQEGKKDGDGDSFSFTVNVERVNYQSVISKYSMPFEFGLALLMITDNPAFCEELVDLTKDSKIVIGIYDNNVETEMTTKYSFDVRHLMTRNVMYKIEERKSEDDEWKETSREKYDPYPMSKMITTENDPYSTTITKIDSTKMSLCVETVNTWIASYESEYIKNKTTKEETTTYNDEDDTEFVEIKDIYKYNETYLSFTLPTFTVKNFLGIEVEDKNKRAVVIENVFVLKENKKNKKTTSTVKTNTVEYTKSTSTVKETPEKFLSLFKVNPDTNVYDLENRSNNTKIIKYKNGADESSPINNLFSAKQMLFEFLLSTSKTIELKDTVEYLLDLYEGTVTLDESRYSMYEPGEFTVATRAMSAIWKNNYTKSEFVSIVNSYVPPDGKGAKGRSYKEYYKKHFIVNAENYFDIATSYGLDPMFIFCIGIHESAYGTSNISQDKGNYWGWGAYDSSPYESALDFEGDASKGIETVCKGLANNYVSPSGTWYQWIKDKGYDPETIEGIGVRYASDTNWATAVKKHMVKIFNVTLEEEIVAGTWQEKMITWAETQVGKSSYYNSATGTYVKSAGYCASFIHAAYYEAGLGKTSGNAKDIPHPNAIPYNSDGSVNWSLLPIGSCLVSNSNTELGKIYGHVALYVGNGYVIEGGASTIRKNKIGGGAFGDGKFLGWGYDITPPNVK